MSESKSKSQSKCNSKICPEQFSKTTMDQCLLVLSMHMLPHIVAMSRNTAQTQPRNIPQLELTWDGNGAEVGREWDGNGMGVGWKWDGSGTRVGRE